MAVYVIGHRPVASKIKIGSAVDPEARLRTLCSPTDRTAIPPDIDRSTLQLLHCFDDGDWMMEHWLHGEFRKARAEGEWFRLGTSADEVVRRISNAVGRFREGRRRFEVGSAKLPAPSQQLALEPSAPKTLSGPDWAAYVNSRKSQPKPTSATPVPVPAGELTELEIRANERELLAELLESRYRQAPNADQREALRAILEIYRPDTWRSGGG